MTIAMRTKSRQAAPSLSKQRLRLWIRILRAARAIEAEVRERLRVEFGVTLPQFDVMAALERKPDGMNDVPTGTVGRLAVRGPTGCRYLADQRQKNYVSDGWNLTGDAFVRDEDGRFHFAARNDDMIVSAGYNIAGPEVEAALLSHPDVAECAVVGATDEERGQIVSAFVVLKVGVVADSLRVKILQDHVKATIAPYKYPRAVKFIDSLPKTQTGKIQRFKLREQVSCAPGRAHRQGY